jgi:hypothetical protein
MVHFFKRDIQCGLKLFDAHSLKSWKYPVHCLQP